MTNNPLVLLVMIAGSAYLAKLWWDDYRHAAAGQPHPRALPGTTKTTPRAVAIACIGALAILVAETLGETHLGLASQQSRITLLFGLYTLVAPIIEEIIFRGYVLIENRGRAVLWASVVGASLIFAALHPFLWRWDDAGFAFTFGAKGWFSTAVVFATSLWLYVARLAPWNPHRSLLPCFAAHFAKNAGVLVIKAAAGYIAGWW